MVSKIRIIGLLTLIFLFSMTNVHAQQAMSWEMDKAHTSVNFHINHFFSEVTGKFTSFDGDFHFDPSNLKGSTASFTIAVKSVNTENKKRDNHLQSEDFFNAKQYPNISFRSTRFEKVSDKEFIVHGKLTIKDKTKDVALPMKLTGMMQHPMKKGTTILGVQIETTLNRTDFGVGTGDWAATMVVGDDVRVNIPMELNRTQ